MDADDIIRWICGFVDHKDPRVRPPFRIKNLPTNQKVIYLRGHLYGVARAAAEKDVDELSHLCDAAPGPADAFNAMEMNGAVVGETICAVNQPMLSEELNKTIMETTTDIFLEIILNASDASDWLEGLCKNVRPEGMNRVGLYANTVRLSVRSGSGKVARARN